MPLTGCKQQVSSCLKPWPVDAAHFCAALPAGQQQATPTLTSSVTADHVLAAVLGVLRDFMGEELPAEQPLLAAGLDSLAAVELRNILSQCVSFFG